MNQKKIALAGIGKIAIDQHIPALQYSDEWELAAVISRHTTLENVECYTELSEMLQARPDIEVISLCLPPVPRFEYAVRAIKAKKHVMLEKPPGATIGECQILADMADAEGVSIYASWHSREAFQVQVVKNWLRNKQLNRLYITWKEDVKRWHPGQTWIWEPGGLGVFDPGINALSIMTEIISEPVRVSSSKLYFPENCQTPIAANLVFNHPDNAKISAEFDFRQQGQQIWAIDIEAGDDHLKLSNGGAELEINGVVQPANQEGGLSLSGEYPRLYANMYQLIRSGNSNMDLTPMSLVADAFLLGEREIVAPFYE